jgi:hypothetical protein
MFAHDRPPHSHYHQTRCGVRAEKSIELVQQSLRQTDFID